MAVPIRMPALGDGMDEGKVVAWPCAVGAEIEKGAPVVLIEADKSEVEVLSSAAGFLRHQYAHPGDVVRCGALLGALTATANEAFDPSAFEVEDSMGF